jgi:hypothetical protein
VQGVDLDPAAIAGRKREDIVAAAVHGADPDQGRPQGRGRGRG